jgi:threonyl-tRNA synthetase
MECTNIYHEAIESISDSVLEDYKKGEEANLPVLFTCIEKGDSLDDFIKLRINLNDIPQVMIYPFAHLSANVSNLDHAKKIILEIEKFLSQTHIISRASIGWKKKLKLDSHASGQVHFYDSSIIDTKIELRESHRGELFVTDIGGNNLTNNINLNYLIHYEKGDAPPQIKEGKNNSLYHLFLPGAHAGQPCLTVEGSILFDKICAITKFQFDNEGYFPLKTPKVWQQSDSTVKKYFKNFPNRQFITKEEQGVFRIAACLGMMKFYKSNYYTSNDLPIGFYEIGDMYRFEQKGELKGLYRLRVFNITDLHVFVQDGEPLWSEFDKCLRLIINVISKFIGLNTLNIVIRYYKTFKHNIDRIYNTINRLFGANTAILHEVVETRTAYWIFKLELIYLDENKIPCQLSTLQIDDTNAKELDLKYLNIGVNEQVKETPFILHCSPVGSIERLLHVISQLKIIPYYLKTYQLAVIYDKNINLNEVSYSNIHNVFKEIRGRVKYISCTFKSLSKCIERVIKEDLAYYVVVGEKNKDEIILRSVSDINYKNVLKINELSKFLNNLIE